MPPLIGNSPSDGPLDIVPPAEIAAPEVPPISGGVGVIGDVVPPVGWVPEDSSVTAFTIVVVPCPSRNCNDDSSESITEEADLSELERDKLTGNNSNEDNRGDELDFQNVVADAYTNFSDELQSRENAEKFVNDLLDEASRQLGSSVEELPKNVSNAMLHNIRSHINEQGNISGVEEAFHKDFDESLLDAIESAWLSQPMLLATTFPMTMQFTPRVPGGGGLALGVITTGIIGGVLVESLMEKTNNGESESNSSKRETAGETGGTANPNPGDPEEKRKREFALEAACAAANVPCPTRSQIEGVADHAFNKHVFQKRDLSRLGVGSPQQLANTIEDGILRAVESPIGDKVRILNANRTAYFDPLHETITIVDKRLGIPGTIFKPDKGFKAFLELK